MNNKKLFEEAIIELVRLNAADIICTSSCTGYNSGDNSTEMVDVL